MFGTKEKLQWLLLPMLVICATALISYFQFTADDALIVSRYAENLINEGRLTYNPGEQVNALTSPLHAMLESVLYALTGATKPAYKITSLIFFGITVLTLLRLFRKNIYSQILIAMIVLLSPCMLLWTVGGLETPILCLLVTLLTTAVYTKKYLSIKMLCAIHLLASLAFLTRFDSVLFTAPLLLYCTWRSGNLKKNIPLFLISLTLPLAWLIFSKCYYGDIFPTSFYAKSPRFYYIKLVRNGIYIFQNLIFTTIIPMALFYRFINRSNRQKLAITGRHMADHWGLYLGLCFMLGYGLTMASVHMMFCFRYFVPYLPALAVVLIDLFENHFSAQRTPDRIRRFRTQFAVFVIAAGLFLTFQLFYVYHNSLNGLVFDLGKYNVGEYHRVGVRDYGKNFIPTLEHNARDIQNHWEHLPNAPRQPCRVFTCIGGVLPYVYRNTYIFEVLASYRHHYQNSLLPCADYIHIITPLHGSIKEQIPGTLLSRLVLISSYTTQFEGEQNFLVYYNPNPNDNPLPARINDYSR